MASNRRQQVNIEKSEILNTNPRLTLQKSNAICL